MKSFLTIINNFTHFLTAANLPIGEIKIVDDVSHLYRKYTYLSIRVQCIFFSCGTNLKINFSAPYL